ncbi:hypothetical protein OG241_27545 [Streptomyces sp. NBC_01390]|uniref:hypothetical protein n=1 Tax=Streptomyces sp. NBC_01390 TaxID=2903850 RepID=UPI00325557F0
MANTSPQASRQASTRASPQVSTQASLRGARVNRHLARVTAPAVVALVAAQWLSSAVGGDAHWTGR